MATNAFNTTALDFMENTGTQNGSVFQTSQAHDQTMNRKKKDILTNAAKAAKRQHFVESKLRQFGGDTRARLKAKLKEKAAV